MISLGEFKILVVLKDYGIWPGYEKLGRAVPELLIPAGRLKKMVKSLRNKGFLSYGKITVEGNLTRYGYSLTQKSINVLGPYKGIVEGIRRRHGI